MSAAEPQFDIVCGDVMDALRLGQVVQEGEYDAAVRVHQYLNPGEAFLINRAALADIVPASWSVLGDA